MSNNAADAPNVLVTERRGRTVVSRLNRPETTAPEVFGSEDAKEGSRALVEKRAPVWTGR